MHRAQADKAAGRKLALVGYPQKKPMKVELSDYAYVVVETLANPEFKEVPVRHRRLYLRKSQPVDRGLQRGLDALIDGKLGKEGNPIFSNGVTNGAYKLDLAEAKRYCAGQHFFIQRTEPCETELHSLRQQCRRRSGLECCRPSVFTPIMAVDTREIEPKEFQATSIAPVTAHRWELTAGWFGPCSPSPAKSAGKHRVSGAASDPGREKKE